MESIRRNSLLRFLFFVLLPAKHAESASGWLDIIPYAAMVSGVVFQAIRERPVLEQVTWVLLVFLGLSLFAGYRLQKQVEPLRPQNRDSLIKSIIDLYAAASKIIEQHDLLSFVTNNFPDQLPSKKPRLST